MWIFLLMFACLVLIIFWLVSGTCKLNVWARISQQYSIFLCSICFHTMKCQETISKGVDLCYICRRKYGVCIKVKIGFHFWNLRLAVGSSLLFKVAICLQFVFSLQCNYGHCQAMFHPSCARSAGYYMNVKNAGGKQQHKAYCEKHSVEQRAKVKLYYFL